MSISELISVDVVLDRFLQQEIAIPATARASASKSQNYLRGVLRNKANADLSFPEPLARADSDFLGGSFARHTKIWPLDDIDLFLPLDAGSLVYMQNGQRLPFTLATDVGTSRLEQAKWKTGNYVDSTKILNGLQAALKDTYPSSKMEIDRHCVNIGTTVAATSESDGIGFDVVPCILLYPDDGSDNFYLMPDGAGGWMRSNPVKDRKLGVELHEHHGSSYRAAIRLTKYWNKTQLNGAFGSYYIELAISKKFNELKSRQKRVSYTLNAFAVAMYALQAAYLNGNLSPLIAEAPLVLAPSLTDVQKTILNADVGNAGLALSQANTDGNESGAASTLNTIFNTDFFA